MRGIILLIKELSKEREIREDINILDLFYNKYITYKRNLKIELNYKKKKYPSKVNLLGYFSIKRIL